MEAADTFDAEESRPQTCYAPVLLGKFKTNDAGNKLKAVHSGIFLEVVSSRMKDEEWGGCEQKMMVGSRVCSLMPLLWRSMSS